MKSQKSINSGKLYSSPLLANKFLEEKFDSNKKKSKIDNEKLERLLFR
jgi:hypothetical protein